MAEPGTAGAKGRPADAAARSGAIAATWLWRLVAVQVLAWTVVPALVNLTPPTDTVESYLWGREWRLLTYKHPQMPGWILDILHRLTGSYVWGHFFASQAMVALTFLAVYALGREMMGPRAALAGVLLLPVTGIFSWGTRQFNHDVAQMPFWAAIAWLLWVAARRNRMGWWVALGLVGGIGLYAKFQVALMLIFGLVWLVADRQARRRLAGPGPWVAMGLVLLLAVPIFVQMARDHYIQLSYAFGRTGQTLVERGRFYFLGVQAALMILLPPALWSIGLIGRRPAPAAQSRLADPQARGYLLWMGLGPISLLLLLSPFLGIAEAWSKPMYSLVGLVAMAFLGGRLAAPGMRRLLVWAFAMTLGTAAAYGAYAPAQCYLAHDLTHACLPSARIAATLESDWHARVPGPVGIVAGDEDMMMNVALFLPEAPSMFTQMNFADAPWITPARIARQGMLVVWTRPETLPAVAQTWIAGRPVGTERFAWARGAPPLVVHYVIVPPEGATP